MSGRPDGFLARWSRRKIETRRGEEPTPAPSPESAAGPAEPVEPALTAEEIAALPKVEDITPKTDLPLFLRKGVPDVLKNAALRRMWSLDPAIRDYVGDARDYAYDWNVPGGVPGNGPLLPTDDPDAMLRRMFGESAPEPRVAGADDRAPPGVSRNREAAAAPKTAEPAPASPAQPGDPSPGERGTAEAVGPKALVQKAAAADGSPAAPGGPMPGAEHEFASNPRPRRHGGAKPL